MPSTATHCEPARVESATPPRTLVLGLGNPILTDDAVGLRVAESVRPLLADRAGVDVECEYRGGLRIVERMVGYGRAILIDALRSGGVPGAIRELGPGEIPTQHSASGHDVNLATAVTFARRAGFDLPADEKIRIIGIEVETLDVFGERCTPRVAAAIDRAVAGVLHLLGS